MEIYAYHGCFKEEKTAGNWFLVNLTLDTDMAKPALTDHIADALNYQVAYQVVKTEMAVPSHLLEHVAERILNALFQKFIQLERASVKVSKMNPPMGGRMKSVSVEISKTKNER